MLHYVHLNFFSVIGRGGGRGGRGDGRRGRGDGKGSGRGRSKACIFVSFRFSKISPASQPVLMILEFKCHRAITLYRETFKIAYLLKPLLLVDYITKGKQMEIKDVFASSHVHVVLCCEH